MTLNINFIKDAIAPLIATILSLILLIFLLLVRKKTPLIYSIIFLQGIAFIWALGKTLEVLSADAQSQWISLQIWHLGFNFSGISWLIFALLYINHRLLNHQSSYILLLVPSIIIHFVFLTNHYHHLYYTVIEYRNLVNGKVFWLTVLLTSVYVIICITLLIKHSMKQSQYEKTQTRLLVIALLIPFLTGIIGAINMTFFDDKFIIRHLTPATFSITAIIAFIAIFKYKFLKIIPMALRETVDNLNESITVADNSNKIIDFNSSFANSFPDVIKKNHS
jgi:hypothetical protein